MTSTASGQNPIEGLLNPQFLIGKRFAGNLIQVENLFSKVPVAGFTGGAIARTLNEAPCALSLPQRISHVIEHRDINQWERDLLIVCWLIFTHPRLSKYLAIDDSGALKSGLLNALNAILKDFRQGNSDLSEVLVQFDKSLVLIDHYHVAGQWVSLDRLSREPGPKDEGIKSFISKLLETLKDDSGLIDLLDVLAKRRLQPWQIFAFHWIIKNFSRPTNGGPSNFFIFSSSVESVSGSIIRVSKQRAKDTVARLENSNEFEISSLAFPNLGPLLERIKKAETSSTGVSIHAGLQKMLS